MAGEAQTLPFVQSYITWQLLKGRPHVDGQADVLSDGACCIGSHTCKHSGIPGLCEKKQSELFLMSESRGVVHYALKSNGWYLSPLNN